MEKNRRKSRILLLLHFVGSISWLIPIHSSLISSNFLDRALFPSFFSLFFKLPIIITYPNQFSFLLLFLLSMAAWFHCCLSSSFLFQSKRVKRKKKKETRMCYTIKKHISKKKKMLTKMEGEGERL